MRFVFSAILALLVTLAMLVIGVYLFEDNIDKMQQRQGGVEVTPLPPHSQLDVADWLREARGDLDVQVAREDDPVMRLPPPPVEFVRPDITGFVQVSFTVQPDGSATDIRVFGAVPAGYYEEEAVASVAGRRWQPDLDDDGRPVASRATEIVEFSLPHDTPRRESP